MQLKNGKKDWLGLQLRPLSCGFLSYYSKRVKNLYFAQYKSQHRGSKPESHLFSLLELHQSGAVQAPAQLLILWHIELLKPKKFKICVFHYISLRIGGRA
jgi:hypothetical protein